MEAIFMGAITWAIIGICYMIYSEFQGQVCICQTR